MLFGINILFRPLSAKTNFIHHHFSKNLKTCMCWYSLRTIKHNCVQYIFKSMLSTYYIKFTKIRKMFWTIFLQGILQKHFPFHAIILLPTGSWLQRQLLLLLLHQWNWEKCSPPGKQQIHLTLLFHQIEPIKNGASLILPSSIATNL